MPNSIAIKNKTKYYRRYDFKNDSDLVIKILNRDFNNLTHTDKLDYLNTKSKNLKLDETINEYLLNNDRYYEVTNNEAIKDILLVADNLVDSTYDVNRLNQRLQVTANLNNDLKEYDIERSELDIVSSFKLENIGDMKLSDVINLIHTKLSFNIALIFVLLY